jgi:hypothetical protein
MQAQNIVAAIKSHEPATEMLDSFFVAAEYHRHCWLGNSDFNHFFDAALEFVNFEVLTWLKTHRLKHSVDFDRIVFMVAARLKIPTRLCGRGTPSNAGCRRGTTPTIPGSAPERPTLWP